MVPFGPVISPADPQLASLFYLAQNSIQTWSDLNSFLGVAALAVTLLMGYVILQIKVKLSDGLESLKEYVSTNYVPSPLDTERRMSIKQLMDNQNKEIEKQRDRTHSMANQVTLLLAKMELMDTRLLSIEQRLTEKNRRISNLENSTSTNNNLLHDFARRIEEVERNCSDLDRRTNNIERR